MLRIATTFGCNNLRLEKCVCLMLALVEKLLLSCAALKSNLHRLMPAEVGIPFLIANRESLLIVLK
jgi:hypothetical protein